MLPPGRKGQVAYDASLLLAMSRMTFAGASLRGLGEIFAGLADGIPDAFPLHLRHGILTNANRLAQNVSHLGKYDIKLWTALTMFKSVQQQ